MIALFATFLTLLGLAVVGGIFWWFVLRPLVSKAEQVMDTADESEDARLQREAVSDAERQQAERELEQQLGEQNDNP